MKKIMSIMLGLTLVLGAATLGFAADDKDKTDKKAATKTDKKKPAKKKASTDKTDKAKS